MAITESHHLDELTHWNHRRVRLSEGVRVREVFYNDPGDSRPFCYSSYRWQDFLRHPSWLLSAYRKPVLELDDLVEME